MRGEAMPDPGARIIPVCVVAAAALAALALCSAACADSIWDRRDRNAAFLYTDNVAAQLGDSLTVLITDQSSFSVKDERESEKTTDQSGKIALSTDLVDLSWAAPHTVQQSSRKFEGSHEYTGRREFADSITVTVVDKLPNGNLVIAGRSERDIAGETSVTVVTGIVKPEDISGANTVSSQRVAHLKIFYETTGPCRSYLREGWLSRIVNFLWPF